MLNLLVLLVSLAAAIRSVVLIVSTNLKHFCGVEKFQSSEASHVAHIELEAISDRVYVFNFFSRHVATFDGVLFSTVISMQASPLRLPAPDVDSLQTLKQSLKDMQHHCMQIEKRIDAMEQVLHANVPSSSSTNSSLPQANFTWNPTASGHTTMASAHSFHEFRDQSEFSDPRMG